MNTETVLQISSDAPWYEQDVYIAGSAYSLELYFNVRAQRWFMSVLDSAGNLLVAGIAVTIDRDLVTAYRYRLLPTTSLYAVDDSNLGREPTFSSFQTTHSMCYRVLA